MKHMRRMICMAIAAVMMLAVPVWGDSTERDYTADAKVWFEMSRLNQRIPEKYLPYFEDMLSLPEDEKAHIESVDVFYSEGSDGLKVTFSGDGVAYDFSNSNSRGRSYLCAMIVDRETGKPISARKFTEEVDRYGTVWETDICITLPEDFDVQKHKLIFFFYNFIFTYEPVTKPYVENGVYRISEIAEADIEGTLTCGDGDVNADGKVNLADAAYTLKYIAGWGNFEYDTVRGDTNIDGEITLTDAGNILKRIAGYEAENAYTAYYMKQYSETADSLYNKKREEYLMNVFRYSGDVSLVQKQSWFYEDAYYCKVLGFSPEDIERSFAHNNRYTWRLLQAYDGDKNDYVINVFWDIYNSAE